MSGRTPGDLGPDDLVLCSGTLFEFGFRDLVEAAAAGGFQAITLWTANVEQARAEGLGDADMRALLADHGLVVADLDPLLNWSPLVLPAEGQAAIPLASEHEFHAIAEALGARSINVTQAFGDHLDLDRAAEDLAGVCDRAREHGLLVTYEFLPWTGVPDAATAFDLIERTGRANATLMVDTWHWFRGGADLDMLGRIPGARIGSTQLNDCPREPRGHPAVESMRSRRMPGEGVIPIADVLRMLDAIGSQAPIGLEVFDERHKAMDAREIGRRGGDALRRVIAEARG